MIAFEAHQAPRSRSRRVQSGHSRVLWAGDRERGAGGISRKMQPTRRRMLAFPGGSCLPVTSAPSLHPIGVKEATDKHAGLVA